MQQLTVNRSAWSGFRQVSWAAWLAYLRNFRSAAFSLLLPAAILVIGEMSMGADRTSSGTWTIAAIALSTGIFALGLLGYASQVAQDRELGLFQRLRAAPLSTWSIILPQGLVQLVAVIIQSVFVVAIALLPYGGSASSLAIGQLCVTVILSGLASITFGQLIVSLVRRAKTVLSLSRLLLFVLFFSEGFFLKLEHWPAVLRSALDWSPVRLSLKLFEASFKSGAWHPHQSVQAVVMACYALGFTLVSVKYFRWNE